MSLLYHEYLWFLLLTIPVAALGIYRFIRGEKLLNLLTQRERKDNLRLVFGIKTFLLTLTFILFLVAMVLALSGPIWGEQPEEADTEGLDICLLLDLSRSMLAADFGESRLSLAKDSIHAIMLSSPESRYSLVTYKGKGYTMIPMTEDTISIQSLLPQLNPGMVTTPGSDLEQGLQKAMETFPENSVRDQFIIVLSDGESLEGQAVSAAREAAGKGLTVHTLGFGSLEGAPIPLANGSFVENASGEIVTSVPDIDTLAEISRQTGGWFSPVQKSGDIAEFVSRLENDQQLSRTRGIRIKRTTHSPLFLLVAVIMIFFNMMIRLVRWKDYL